MDYNKIYDDAYNALNAEQQDAVDSIDGPVIVVAGPGTGKTQILALRIANIIKTTDVSPSSILALTFTDAGVTAMKNRLISIIGPVAYEVKVHTYHSFCSSIISEFSDYFKDGAPLKSIDQIYQYTLFRSLFDSNNYDLVVNRKYPYENLPQIISYISKLKSELVTPKQLYSYAINKLRELEVINVDDFKYKYQVANHNKAVSTNNKLLVLSQIYKDYTDRLEKEGLYDFSDMILLVLEKFKTDPNFLLLIQEKFQYLLVDEFQDTNNSQYSIINHLISFYKDKPNLFVVGDDDQSIYRFQGASLENIHNFLEKYPQAKKIILKSNYRSSQLILDAATDVINNNLDRLVKDKTLIAENNYKNSPLEIARFNTHTEEFYFLVNKVKSLIDSGVTPAEITIITRNNRELIEIADFFSGFGIKYTLSANSNILDNKYVIKIIEALKYFNNMKDFKQIFKFCFIPSLNLTLKDIYTLSDLVKKNNSKNLVVLSESLDQSSNLYLFLSKLIKLNSDFQFESFSTFIRILLKEFAIFDDLIANEKLDDINAIRSFLNFIEDYFKNHSRPLLANFLQLLDTVFDHNLEIKGIPSIHSHNFINLMTAHKSKGLEFEHVFISVCIDKKWGGARKINEAVNLPSELFYNMPLNDNDEPEERRLFYTALTRAKKHIYITSALSYSSIKDAIPSKFVSEIDKDKTLNLHIDELNFADLKNIYVDNNLQKHDFYKLSDFIKNNIIPNFKFSATNLNTFLSCKRKFLFNYLLSIPEAKNLSLIEGSLLHLLIDTYYKYNKRGQILTDVNIVAIIDNFVASNDLSKTEVEYLKNNSLSIFKNWLIESINTNTLPKALYTEYSFFNKDIRYNNVPITGKIDLIEVVNESNKSVRAIDFKSGKPKSKNVILGKNQNSDNSIYNQLQFYKLLIESDKSLGLKVVQGAINFLQPDNKNKYSTVYIEFNNDDYNSFKNQLVSAYENLLSLDFLNELNDKCNCKENCAYNNFL